MDPRLARAPAGGASSPWSRRSASDTSAGNRCGCGRRTSSRSRRRRTPARSRSRPTATDSRPPTAPAIREPADRIPPLPALTVACRGPLDRCDLERGHRLPQHPIEAGELGLRRLAPGDRAEQLVQDAPSLERSIEGRRRRPGPGLAQAAEPPAGRRVDHACALGPAGELLVALEPLAFGAARGPVHGVDQVERGVAADIGETGLDERQDRSCLKSSTSIRPLTGAGSGCTLHQ